MKQFLHLKSLLIALLVLFGGGSVSAQEETETITFSEKRFSNGESVNKVYGTGITITFNKGTSSNTPTYYNTGSAVRVYGGGYFIVTANGNNITKIVIGFGSGDGSNTITTDVGTYSSDGTWTGNAESVKFTIGGTSGHRRIASIAVTYTTETPSGEENPNNSFAVEEDNATIGEPYTMPEFTTSSDGAKSYSSSDTDVATISSSGQITLIKEGTTEITVSTAQTATYAQGSASYLLHVAKGTPVLSFAQETVTAYLGTNQNGPALTNPGDGTPTYTISDPEIATIQSNGYIQPKAKGTATVTVTTSETDAWKSATASYTLNVEEPFLVDAVGIYELVKDASILKNGDQILISYIPSDGAGGYVLGEHKSNNFGATFLNSAAVSSDKSTIEITTQSPVTAAVLEGSTEAWYFHTNEGYLCATSSSNNYLGAKTLDKAGNDAKATINIADNGNATVVFQGNNSRNNLRYNSDKNALLFSCYTSSSDTKRVQIYRKLPQNVPPTITFSPASGAEVNYGTQVTITARTATSITYRVNDGEAVTVEGTSAAVTINTNSTITATATNDYGTCDPVTAEYTIHAESPAFTYDPTEYEITIGDDFTAPVLGKAADYDGTITYSSDNTEVAEVDAETGAVTVKGAGTATITATGTATEHFEAATASYTITVNKKTSAVSFAEAVVEITYGDNYNKQAATTEGVNGKLVYTSSDESIVKFHGNNVIDVLGPGTVTITATAPATDTTEESSATYTLKVYAPADPVVGSAKVLNEDFSSCNGTNNTWGGSSGFVTVPTDLGWEATNCNAGPGYLKLGSANNAGSATSPSFSVAGEAPLSFALAPWIATGDTEDATVNVTLTHATFANGESTMTLSTGNLTQKVFTTFDQYTIVGNSDEVTITFSGAGTYDRFFLDNVVVGGGSQPAHEINLTFSSAGYLTWVATADIDFSQTEGVTAYQITEATPQGITAEEVQEAPKGAALLLKGAGTVELKRTSGVAPLQNNKMLACTDASVTGITGSATSTYIYVLGNGNKGLGFYMLSGTLQAGKGYLNISGGAGAKPSFIAFEETTDISNAAVETKEDDGTYYNLQGVRVMNPQKGIYINNGKKIVIK